MHTNGKREPSKAELVAALKVLQAHLGRDGRSLRATGRTEQFNIRMRGELRAQIKKAADDAGISVAEWVEIAMLSALGRGRS